MYRGSVSTHPSNTHTRAVDNGVPLWRGEKERVAADGGGTEAEGPGNKRKAEECLCVSPRPGAAQFLLLSSRGSDYQRGRVSGWRALPLPFFHVQHLHASSRRTMGHGTRLHSANVPGRLPERRLFLEVFYMQCSCTIKFFFFLHNHGDRGMVSWVHSKLH